ncbi:hypothetical protein ACIQMR_33640 [Streptomyces sp. NPDC091376]|uniref:hypothetical protein n=1 Tax=Streptomyces sp. NPDC091376 TaxID=3365994 RepID=UPI003804B33F
MAHTEQATHYAQARERFLQTLAQVNRIYDGDVLAPVSQGLLQEFTGWLKEFEAYCIAETSGNYFSWLEEYIPENPNWVTHFEPIHTQQVKWVREVCEELLPWMSQDEVWTWIRNSVKRELPHTVTPDLLGQTLEYLAKAYEEFFTAALTLRDTVVSNHSLAPNQSFDTPPPPDVNALTAAVAHAVNEVYNAVYPSAGQQRAANSPAAGAVAAKPESNNPATSNPAPASATPAAVGLNGAASSNQARPKARPRKKSPKPRPRTKADKLLSVFKRRKKRKVPLDDLKSAVQAYCQKANDTQRGVQFFLKTEMPQFRTTVCVQAGYDPAKYEQLSGSVLYGQIRQRIIRRIEKAGDETAVLEHYREVLESMDRPDTAAIENIAESVKRCNEHLRAAGEYLSGALPRAALRDDVFLSWLDTKPAGQRQVIATVLVQAAAQLIKKNQQLVGAIDTIVTNLTMEDLSGIDTSLEPLPQDECFEVLYRATGKLTKRLVRAGRAPRRPAAASSAT